MPPEDTLELTKQIAAFDKKFTEDNEKILAFVTKANEEATLAGSVSNDTKTAMEAFLVQIKKEQGEGLDRIQALEQNMKMAPSEKTKILSIGQQFLESEEWKHMSAGRSGSARLEFKTAIVNATGASQPLVAADRLPGIITPANRRLTIRDLIPTGITSSNLVEFAKENVFTNNAGPQYSSPDFENVNKNESGITFTLDSEAVATLAHWIPASKQVLSDSPMLMSYIQGRLLYGLKLKEEDEILNGDGASGNLSGLLNTGNFTAYNRAISGDTFNDTIRRAITQAQLSEYMATAIVLNPEDWEAIELTKSSTADYISTDINGNDAPQEMGLKRRWGLPVVSTNSIAQGTFLVGAFDMAAQIWDRQQSSIEVSRENSDNFVKNMITILAEERLALTVYRPASLISGSFA